ncbi:MAG: hypothetical protein COB02_02845 [Candidatus Cloacimonadota bacterium]|nr:MAG: hypothetical protein COB02_02845 [Candidatus Cloacimonadota bacterium]
MSTLKINLQVLKYNLEKLVNISKLNSIEFVPIIKAFSNVDKILSILDIHAIKKVGLSRLKPLGQLKKFKQKPDLICIALLDKKNYQEAFLKFDEIYLSSELSLIHYINLAKSYPKKKQKLVFILDSGDHREGLSSDSLLQLIQSYHTKLPKNLSIEGIATTFGCNLGLLPNETSFINLKLLVDKLESILLKKLSTVSVGGSIILKSILDEKLPKCITQIRVGEAFLLGTIPSYGIDHPDLNQKAFSFQTNLVELSEKPNFTGQSIGYDALGNSVQINDKKTILQGILNFGLLDVDIMGLSPQSSKIKFCRQNSDYTMIEMNDNSYQLFDSFSFTLNYRALAQALCSSFVEKQFYFE